MKLIKSFLLILFITSAYVANAQQDPWTQDQLMEPSELAQKIEKDGAKDYKIIHIGFEDMIQGSVNAGATYEKEGLDNLRQILSKLPKDEKVVMYCGCCPMTICPNIRPAFELAMNMGFKNAMLLNLTDSIKADWLDYDYPIK